MAGLLRQKGKDVRVVNASRTPPRYDFLDPDGDALRALRDDGPTRPTWPTARWRSSSTSRPGASSATWPSYVRDFPGPRVVIDHHVSQDDLGAIFLKDTTAEATGTLVMSGRDGPGRDVHARGRHRPADGDRDGHRLVPPPEHPARDAPHRGRAGRVGAPRSTEIYRLLFERNTLGRLKLMGETLVGPADRAGRADRLRDGHPRRPRADRRDPARTPRTWSISPSASRASRSACCSSSRRGAGCKVSFRSRNGLDCARLAGDVRRRRPPRGGRRDAARDRCPRASPASSPRSARPLIPTAGSAQAIRRASTTCRNRPARYARHSL